MNDNENKTEILTEFPEENTEEMAPLEVEIHEAASEGVTQEEAMDMNEDEMEALSSHPMFPRFARGRKGSFQAILVAFREMLHASAQEGPTETITAKMTPAATNAVSDVALTERQRAIARAAGMTYREYYHILNG